MTDERSQGFAHETFFDCGDVELLIKDPEGLALTMAEAASSFIIVANDFSAEELGILTKSELSVVDLGPGIPKALTGMISYLPDTERTTTHNDLFDIYTSLITQGGHDEDAFTFFDQMGSEPRFVVTLDEAVSVTVIIHAVARPSDHTPAGLVTLRSELSPKNNSEQNYDQLEQVTHLWGDIHTAIARLSTGKHARRPDAPVRIVIERFREGDEALALWQVLGSYEFEQQQTTATWPPLDIQHIDVERLIEAVPDIDEAILRRAIAFLVLEKRQEYGATGNLSAITQSSLIRAVKMLGHS